jgi:hypothetical protein
LGFDVSGKSFYLWIDDPAFPYAPIQKTVSFVSSDPHTLDQVVARINSSSCMNEVVAFNDNGFLRLMSPRLGANSYLRIETLVTAGSSVLSELGLFAETVSRGGDLRQAQNIDPDRQVANPGQLSWMEGEQFESSVFNRMTFQLAVNSDRSGLLLDKKRIAKRAELETTYSVRSPNQEGIQLSGWVYTGDATAPSTSVLEKWFAILDSDGRELVKENDVQGTTYTDLNFAWDSDKLYQVVTSASAPFLPIHETGDYYVKPTNLSGGPSALNGVLLKIIEYHSPTEVIINPVVPGTGVKYQITESGRTGSLDQVQTVRCLVDGVYDKAPELGGVRIENSYGTKQASTAVTRIDKNNRIYCAGADFGTDAAPIVREGDLVVWAGAAPNIPYSNTGSYRVTKVVDKWTLELASVDFGPVYLNPSTSGSLGTVTVTTDGRFWRDPFIRFLAFPNGAIPSTFPSTPQTIRVVYYDMSTIRTATDDATALAGGSLRYGQEADETIQKAILAIIGPSATTITDYLYGSRESNLENIFNLFWLEHHNDSGRHATIRPDVINMEPGNTGNTVIVRNTATDESNHNLKVILRNAADSVTLSDMSADGYFGSLHTNIYPRTSLWAGNGQAFSLEMAQSYDAFLFTTVVAGASIVAADTYYYRVAGVAPDGTYGPPNLTEEPAVVPTSNDKYVRLTWDRVAGAARYVLFRRRLSNPTVWEELVTDLNTGTPGACAYEDFGYSWNPASITPAALATNFQGATSKIRGQTSSWIGTPLAVNGGTLDNATFSVSGPSSGLGKIAAFYRPSGSVNQGTSYQGVGSPLMVLDMETGTTPATQHIAKWEFKRWNGSTWSLISDLRVLGDANTSTFNFRDNGANNDVIVSVDTTNGGQITVQRTATGNAAFVSTKAYGDSLSMTATSPSTTSTFGIRSGGNFYLTNGAANQPLLVGQSSGNAGIGFSSLDTTISSTYRLDVNAALRVANETAGGDSYLRVGGRQTTDAASYIDLVGDSTYTTYGLRIVRNGGSAGTTQIAQRGVGNLIFSTYGPISGPYNGEYGNFCFMPGIASGNMRGLYINSTSQNALYPLFYVDKHFQIGTPSETRYLTHLHTSYSNMFPQAGGQTGSVIGQYIEVERDLSDVNGVLFDTICGQQVDVSQFGSGYNSTISNLSGLKINVSPYAGGTSTFTSAYGCDVYLAKPYGGGSAVGGFAYGFRSTVACGANFAYSAAEGYRAVVGFSDSQSAGNSMTAYSFHSASCLGSFAAAFMGEGTGNVYTGTAWGVFLDGITSTAGGTYGMGGFAARNISGGAGSYFTHGMSLYNITAAATQGAIGVRVDTITSAGLVYGMSITGLSTSWVNAGNRAYGISVNYISLPAGWNGLAAGIIVYSPRVSGVATQPAIQHGDTTANLSATGQWNPGSSIRFKQDVEKLSADDAGRILDQLSPVTFRFKTALEDGPKAGFIAEEMPELVATSEKTTLNVPSIISVLTKALQSLKAEVADLKRQLATA